jgi:hypothetical protein
MNELRIPVVPLEAEVLLRDGENISGSIFLPNAASNHTGPIRLVAPEEAMDKTIDKAGLAGMFAKTGISLPR